MRQGEALLGELHVAWSVSHELDGAAGGLEHLAPCGGPPNARWSVTRGGLEHLAPCGGPPNARWSVTRGDPGPRAGAYHAFFDTTLLSLHPEEPIRVWSPTAALTIAPASVTGVASGPCSLSASIALHVLAAHAGLVHLHAALVRLGDRHVLAPAGSGGGKTSLALAVARAGGELLADDAVYLGPDRVAWAVRRPVHAAPATLAAHPDLERLGPVQDGVLAKIRLRPPIASPAPPVRIDAIVVPSIEPGVGTSIRSIRAAELFPMLLGAATLATLEGTPRREEALDRIADLACVPSAHLVAGPDALADLSLVPEAIASWLGP